MLQTFYFYGQIQRSESNNLVAAMQKLTRSKTSSFKGMLALIIMGGILMNLQVSIAA